MALEIKIPAVGESITEVTIAKWLKKDGEAVKRDEVIAELESDKAPQLRVTRFRKAKPLPKPATSRVTAVPPPATKATTPLRPALRQQPVLLPLPVLRPQPVVAALSK
jgi:hypothetical protein